MKQHKAEVFDYLRLLNMPQHKLESPLLIHSAHLGENLFLVANETQAREIESEGKACYLPGEIRTLLANSMHMDEATLKDHLTKVHIVKKTFPGSKIVPKPSG